MVERAGGIRCTPCHANVAADGVPVPLTQGVPKQVRVGSVVPAKRPRGRQEQGSQLTSSQRLFSAGGFLCCFTVPWVSDRFGRKWGIVYVDLTPKPLYNSVLTFNS